MTHDLFPCCKFELLIFVRRSSRVIGWASRCWLCCVILPIMMMRVEGGTIHVSPNHSLHSGEFIAWKLCEIWFYLGNWNRLSIVCIFLILQNIEDLKYRTINCGIYHSLGIQPNQNKNCKYRKDRESEEVFFLIGMAWTKSYIVRIVIAFIF